MTLSKKECVPCKGGVPPLKGEELERLKEQVDGWDVVEEHHPDIFLTWGKIRITMCTHKIDGLTESDFILAAKIDEISVD